MEGTEDILENGKCEEIDEQYKSENGKFLYDFDHMDNKSYEFEARFNGNDDYSDGEERESVESDRYGKIFMILKKSINKENLLKKLEYEHWKRNKSHFCHP